MNRIIENSNHCVICGDEIPEGDQVCSNCRNNISGNRCIFCGRPLIDRESIYCDKCAKKRNLKKEKKI